MVGHRLKIQTDHRIGSVDAADAVYRLFNRLQEIFYNKVLSYLIALKLLISAQFVVCACFSLILLIIYSHF